MPQRLVHADDRQVPEDDFLCKCDVMKIYHMRLQYPSVLTRPFSESLPPLIAPPGARSAQRAMPAPAEYEQQQLQDSNCEEDDSENVAELAQRASQPLE